MISSQKNSDTMAGSNSMNVTVVGTGYVGLVTGACLAHWGHFVTCIDQNPQKLEALKQGIMPIYEPGLDVIVSDSVEKGNLQFSSDPRSSVSDADIVFVAVGTPPSEGTGGADLTQIFQCINAIAPLLKEGAILAVKSTVPVGTGDEIERIVYAVRGKSDCYVVSNPEFLREGSAVEDFFSPDRVIIGTKNSAPRDVILRLYLQLVRANVPILFMKRRTSELTKYAANALLATKISFINEMADFCERADADIIELSEGLGLDRRIGKDFLRAGPGFGGSCLPKDTSALLCSAQQFGMSLRIVEQVVAVNLNRKQVLVRKVLAALHGNPSGKTVGILGLSFKPDTDDIRESPSIPLIKSLLEAGVKVRAFDPVAMENARVELPEIKFCADVYECATGADVVAIVTDWVEFQTVDLHRLSTAMSGRNVIDFRNILDLDRGSEARLNIIGVGRNNLFVDRTVFEAVG